MKLFKLYGPADEVYYAIASTINEARNKVQDDIGFVSYGWEYDTEELPDYPIEEGL